MPNHYFLLKENHCWLGIHVPVSSLCSKRQNTVAGTVREETIFSIFRRIILPEDEKIPVAAVWRQQAKEEENNRVERDILSLPWVSLFLVDETNVSSTKKRETGKNVGMRRRNSSAVWLTDVPLRCQPLSQQALVNHFFGRLDISSCGRPRNVFTSSLYPDA